MVEIRIPAGVGDGMVLTVSGKGNAARHGGVNGDLQVVIEEEHNPELVRDGNDLIHNLNITVPTALLGGSRSRRVRLRARCCGWPARACPT